MVVGVLLDYRIQFSEREFTEDLAGKHEFLIGWDNEDSGWRISGADICLGGLAGIIFGMVQANTEGFQVSADSGTDVRAILADAGGEYECVDAAEFDYESTDPMTY